MRLIGCGDSWCWGSELVDPIEEPIPIMKLNIDAHHLHLKPVNEAFRLKHKYLNIFAESINATEIVDLSRCAYSNDAISRTLLEWLSIQGYTSGRDTSDLFITIGWTSPERTEFYFKDYPSHTRWQEFGPWVLDYDYKNDGINQMMRLYFEHFYCEEEFLLRWVTTVWNTEMMLKQLNIKYVMHQAFYHHYQKMIHQWDDKKYTEKIHTTELGIKKIWESIDKVKFINKDSKEQGTMHHYLLSQVNNDHKKVFEVIHPNANGHAIWAEYMYKYCVENNLL